MTGSSDARVPHDPADLRDAAKLMRISANAPFWKDAADRLEAWADDLEHEPEAHLLAEVKRHRDANLVRAVLSGYGDQDEFVNEAINAKDFDRVPWLVAQKAVDHSERLAPLEAAVLDAAKRWADLEYGTGNHYDNAAICESLIDAVRALEEATDA